MSKPKNNQKQQADQQTQNQQTAQEQTHADSQVSQQAATDTSNGDAAPVQSLEDSKEVGAPAALDQVASANTTEQQHGNQEKTEVAKTEVAKTDAPQKEEANVEEKPVASVAPEVMAKQQAQGAMAIYIDRIKKDGTAGENMVVETMEAYLAVMGSGKPLDSATIVREQTRLYTMFKNIGRRTDDFRKAVVVARFFFKENADGAFHDTRINRGHEALQLSSDDRRAFYTYLQLFKIIASVNDLKDVKKSVDVSRSLTNPVIPAEVKERYVSLVN